MSNTTSLVLAFFVAAAPAFSVHAAPASQEQADRLTSVFERYVGHPAPGVPGGVTVVPVGQDYRVSFDIGRLAHALESFGITIEPATSTLTLTPNDNGTWKVAGDAFPPLVLHYKGQTLSSKASTYAVAGTFDPKIPGFTDASSVVDDATFDQDAPGLSQQRKIGHISSTQRAAAAESGSATMEAHYAVSDVADKITLRSPAPKATVEVAPAPPPIEFSYTALAAEADLSVDRLRVSNLLDLWAFFVAHSDRDSIAGSQDELRRLLRSTLPLFAGLKQSGSADNLTVTTPTGPFSVRKFAGSLDLTDLAAAGKAALGLSVDGLTVPSMDLPPWAVGFIPTAVDLKPTLVGFHLDEAAKEAVEDFDIGHDGFTSPQRERIAHLAWPGDGRVMLAPSRISSSLLDIRLEGDVTLGAVPAGRMTVTATGLDKAIATLQSAAGTDPSAAQLLAQVVFAKNLAKPNSDGSMGWLIEASGTGPLTVNGAPLN